MVCGKKSSSSLPVAPEDQIRVLELAESTDTHKAISLTPPPENFNRKVFSVIFSMV